MRRLRNNSLAYDQRTGRLERAIDLINDGDKPGIKVHRREADPRHPQRTARRIGPDHSNLFPGLQRIKPEGENFAFSYGYSLGPDLWAQRALPIVSWEIGSAVLTATAVDLGVKLITEDLTNQFALESGLGLLTQE